MKFYVVTVVNLSKKKQSKNVMKENKKTEVALLKLLRKKVLEETVY